jgi:hypothetical protein
VSEARWFTFAAGGRSWAVPEDAVWTLSQIVPIRPLPGAQPWCAGWILLREHLVPVFGAGPFSEGTEDSVLVVLGIGGSLLALPCSSADIAGARLGACELQEGPLPLSGALEGGAAAGAAVIDVARLYRGLGLPIESGPEDRG